MLFPFRLVVLVRRRVEVFRGGKARLQSPLEDRGALGKAERGGELVNNSFDLRR